MTYADGTLIGDANGIFKTDVNGEIRIEGLKPGKSVIVTETKAPDGFLIDTQSQTVQIKEGRTVSLTFANQPKGKLIIQKRDSATGQPLSGAEFRVTTAAGCEVGLDGVIGTATLNLLLRFSDLLGKKMTSNPNFPGGITPHIWDDNGKLSWYVYQPSSQDYQTLSDAVSDYLQIFQEMEQNADQGWQQAMK